MAVNPLTGKPHESGSFDPRTGARTPKPRAPKPSGPRVPRGTQTVRQPGRHAEPQPTARGGRRQTISRPTSTPAAAMPGDRDFGTSAGSQSGQTRPPSPGDVRRRATRKIGGASDPVVRQIDRIARSVVTGGSPYRTTLRDTRVVGASALDQLNQRHSGGGQQSGLSALGVGGFDPAMIQEAADSRQNDGGLRGLIKNFGSDVADIGKAPFYLGYGVGYGATKDIARGNAPWERDSMLRQLAQQSGQGIVDDFRTRWGPAGTVAAKSGGNPFAIGAAFASGDPDAERAKQQLYEHPGYAALDVAGAYSGAGAATRLGARGVAAAAPKGSTLARVAAQIGENSVLPAGQAVRGGRISSGARYRAPKRQSVPDTIIRDEAGNVIGRRVTPDATREVRPYSANPMTRGVQKQARKAGQAISRRAQARADRRVESGDANFADRYLSSEARHGRLNAKGVRDIVHTASEEVERTSAVARNGHDKAAAAVGRWIVKSSPKRKTSPRSLSRQVDEAVKAHLQGLFDQPDMTPQEAHAAAVRRFEGERVRYLKENKGADGAPPRTTVADEQLEVFKSLPDDLIDPAKLPEPVRRLIDEDRALSQYASKRRVEAGDMTADEVKARAELPSKVVIGGSRYDPLASPVDDQLAAVRARVKSLVSDAREANAAGDLPRYRTVTRQISAARRERQKLIAQRNRTRGEFTEPRREYGREGVYVPDIEADRRGRGGPIAGESDLTRFSGETIHRNTAALSQRNANLTDRNLVSYAADRADRSVAHRQVVETVVDRYALRRETGDLLIEDSPSAEAFRRLDPQKHTVVSVRLLRKVLNKSYDMPRGKFLDDVQSGEAFLTPGEAIRMPEKGDGFVVIPKSVERALRGAMNPPGSGSTMLRGYDSVLGVWRRGILAFAPRWYINNTLGNSTQFLLMDPKEFFNLLNWARANRKGFRETIPARVAGGVSSDVRVSPGRPRIGKSEMRGRTAGAFMRMSDLGYNMNHGLEGLMRRAAFRSKLKSSLRREGADIDSRLRRLSGRGKLTDLKPDEIMAAFDAAPLSFKNQVIRDFELFLGDYKRLSPTEQAVFRRIAPFYSWLRVIGRLSLSLPFRHPKRTWLVANVGRELGKQTNPEDALLPGYQRGRVKVGPYSFSTTSKNPFRTWDETVGAAASGDWQGAIASLTNDISPAISPIIQAGTGRDAFNREFSAPPGWNGSWSDVFGSYIDDPLGGTRRVNPAPSLPELYLRQIPFAPQFIRGAAEAAAGSRAYDTTSTVDLVRLLAGGRLGKVNSADLFRPPSDYDPSFRPVNPAYSTLFSLLGGNPERMDPKAIEDNYRKEQQRKKEGQRQTERKRRKNASAIRRGG